MPFNNVIQEFRASVPDCVAAGIVELATGKLVQSWSRSEMTGHALERLVPATNLLSASGIDALRAAFQSKTSDRSERSGQFFEVIVVSDAHVHIYQRSRTETNLVLAARVGAAANLGMVLTKTRLAVDSI